MKGPYQRLRWDLRRTWECPECGRHARTPGDATFCICSCQKSQKFTEQRCMRLVSEFTKHELEMPPRPDFVPQPADDPRQRTSGPRGGGRDGGKRPRPRRTEKTDEPKQAPAAEAPAAGSTAAPSAAPPAPLPPLPPSPPAPAAEAPPAAPPAESQQAGTAADQGESQEGQADKPPGRRGRRRGRRKDKRKPESGGQSAAGE